MKEYLSTNKINFAYMDISESLFNLKTYLKLRDTRPEYEAIKEKGIVGIPVIVINNGEKLIFDEKPDLEELRD